MLVSGEEGPALVYFSLHEVGALYSWREDGYMSLSFEEREVIGKRKIFIF